MKIKSIIATLGLALLAVASTAFVQKTPQKTSPLEAAEKEAFLQYLSQFKKVELPYSIGLDNFKGYENYLGKPIKKTVAKPNVVRIKATPFLPESNAGKFSRMGPPTLEAIARFYPNDQMVAVVYSSKPPFGGEEHLNYRMVVYDLNGNILPKQKDKLAYRQAFDLAYSSTDKTMTCTIDASGNISQGTYTNQWLKDLYKHGMEDNKITGVKQEKTSNYRLNSRGEFVESKHGAIASRAEP
jgi:hypothetical protein